MTTKDFCSSCGKTVMRGRSSRPEIVCHDCRRRPEQSCVECGAVFRPEQGQRPRKYCSLQCANSVNVDLMRAANLAAGKSTQPTATCPTCGTDFSAKMMKAQGGRPRKRQVYCSRACSIPARAEAWEWRSILPTCKRCGEVTYRGRLARLCGICVEVARRENWAKTSDARKKELERVTVECEACGTELTRVGNQRRRWCPDCAKRHNRHRRRARAYGVAYEPIDPMEIYKRDKWICHICTDPIRKVPGNEIDVDGWSLDHIIPMVHGGPHLKWNVAASHWGCNVKKADRFFVEVA